MSSHLVRLQHHQARQNQLYRTGSNSSLRSGESNQQYTTGATENANGGHGSIISGSILSGGASNIRSGSKLDYNQTAHVPFEVLVSAQRDSNENGYGITGSVIGSNQIQNGSYVGRPGYAMRSASIVSYQPSTIAGKSTQGGRSLNSASHLKLSRSLGASKVRFIFIFFTKLC
ncbi:unnamed protein product [Protopolystoma xenopodis]|nr:unnamed protein product [Protopolystoma xenopodis]